MEECVSIINPANEHICTVDGAVAGKPEANVAVRPDAHLEDNVRFSHCPQELVVLVQIDDMIPALLGTNTAD